MLGSGEWLEGGGGLEGGRLGGRWGATNFLLSRQGEGALWRTGNLHFQGMHFRGAGVGGGVSVGSGEGLPNTVHSVLIVSDLRWPGRDMIWGGADGIGGLSESDNEP